MNTNERRMRFFTRGFLAAIILTAFSMQGMAAEADMGLQFTPDGSAILKNSQVEVLVNNKTSRLDGIRGWNYKPTGYEMVDVLFRDLGAGGGHVLGLLWEGAEVGAFPSRIPDVGNLFIPAVAGVTDDDQAVVLEQVSQGTYRLTRTLILRRDCAMIEARFRLENLEDDPTGFALRLHNVVSPGARGQYQSRNDVVDVPTVEGVRQWSQNLPLDKFRESGAGFIRGEGEDMGTLWRNRKSTDLPLLAENWIVQRNPENGDGMAILVKNEDLRGFYNHPATTVEPILRAMALRKTETWETVVFLGAFGGPKNATPQGVTPLYITLDPLKHAKGQLLGKVTPMFAGKLRVVSAKETSKVAAEYEAKPMTPIPVQAKVASDWLLVAVDQQGMEIGSIAADGTVQLIEPEISHETKKRPEVTGPVYQDADEEAVIRRAIEARDFVIQCDWTESEALRALAEKIALQLGVGLAWTPRYSGKMLALGSVEKSATVRNAGLLKQSVDASWPGPNHGAILAYDNFESTAQPLILVAGSDEAGALAAGEAFYDKYIKDLPTAKGFDFWASPVSDLAMVWSRPRTAPVLKQIAIQSARSEYDSAQIVLTAYEDLSDIEVTVDPLLHVESGKPISARFTKPYRKRHGPIQVRWAENFPLKVEEGWPGTPDALLSRPVKELPAGKSQVLWLTTLVADDAEAGVYRSAIHVKANGESRSIPIELKVYDFSLPVVGLKGEAYMAMELMSPNQRLRATDIERMITSLVEHRFQIVFLKEPELLRWHVSPEGKFKGIESDSFLSNADGTLLMDTSRFDWMLDTCDRFAKPVELEYNVAILQVLGWPEGVSSFKRAFPERYTDKPEREGHLMQSYWSQEMLEMFRKHLERRNLMERVAIKVGDEPPGFDFWWENHAQAAIESGLQFGTAFNAIDWKQAERALGSKLNRFKPLYQQFDPEFAKKAQEAGHDVGWYNCGPPPRSGVGASASELRSYYWQAARYGLDFVSRWGVQCWGSEGTTPDNVWTFRYSHHHSLVYPEHPEKPAYGEEGRGLLDFAPLDSIRYELIRDGIEDADYVLVLRELIKKAKTDGHEEKATQAEAVLEKIWQEMFPTLNQFDPPYANLMAARMRVAEEIESLQKVVGPLEGEKPAAQ